MQSHRVQNPKNVIIGHFNVNSLRNKIVAVEELMRNKVDICLVSETKFDETSLHQQFKIHGYKVYRKDINKHGGGVIFYMNENISCKAVSRLEEVPDYCEIIFIEFSIKTRKWLSIGLYKPPSQNENLSLILNKHVIHVDMILLC